MGNEYIQVSLATTLNLNSCAWALILYKYACKDFLFGYKTQRYIEIVSMHPQRKYIIQKYLVILNVGQFIVRNAHE